MFYYISTDTSAKMNALTSQTSGLVVNEGKKIITQKILNADVLKSMYFQDSFDR